MFLSEKSNHRYVYFAVVSCEPDMSCSNFLLGSHLQNIFYTILTCNIFLTLRDFHMKMFSFLTNILSENMYKMALKIKLLIILKYQAIEFSIIRELHNFKR